MELWAAAPSAAAEASPSGETSAAASGTADDDSSSSCFALLDWGPLLFLQWSEIKTERERGGEAETERKKNPFNSPF